MTRRLLSLALLATTACSTPAPRPDGDGLLRFSGTVEARRDDCFFDGICNVTVAGITITTMTGRRAGPPPVWGESAGQPPLGAAVDVLCRATAPRECTLEGSRSLYLRTR